MRKVERKRMNPEHKKYFLVGSLCIAIFLMLGIGYAALYGGVGGFGGSFVYYDDSHGTRPVVFLKSSIQLTGGNGTQSNPFVIG